MDFAFDSEQLALRERVVAFARESLNEGLVEADQEGAFSREAWGRCAEFGILGLGVPAEYGGGGHDPVTVALAMEGLGYGCRDNGLVFGLNAQMWTVQLTLAHFGGEEQKQKYLRAMCDGSMIAGHALTEPEAGSDAYAMTTTAVRSGSGYVLNGKKHLVTLGPVADVYLVFASTSPEDGRWGLSAFVVERGAKGLEVGAVQHKMGLRTVPIGALEFRDCFVPEEARVGAEGAGLSISNESLDWERSCMLACYVGSMERQLETAIDYAKRRKQFGQPIGKFQSVSNRIADMKLRLESARMLAYRAAWKKARGESAVVEGALAKLAISEAFVDSSLEAILVHGGVGYLTENEIERDLRDAVGGLIYGGTSDLQRLTVARLLGL